MSFQNNQDNVYQVGTIIFAKEDPTIKLEIMKYRSRIYYCDVVGNEQAKQRAYFERELISPTKQSHA
jgi:hypothetical protein